MKLEKQMGKKKKNKVRLGSRIEKAGTQGLEELGKGRKRAFRGVGSQGCS